MPRNRSLADSRNADFGAKLRSIRRQRNLSQVTVAKEIGITYQQLHKYESGENRISLARALDICHALGITITELVQS